MSLFIPNLRFAARALRKSPIFTCVAILLIGLGVGVVTAVFAVVDQVLLRPLPYPAQDRLAYLSGEVGLNGATLRRLDDVAAFYLWAAASDGDVNLSLRGGEPLEVHSAEVTPSFFTMFGARPLQGRVLVESDGSDRPRETKIEAKQWLPGGARSGKILWTSSFF